MRSDRVVFSRKFFSAAAFLVLSVSCRAAAEEGPGDCRGIGFDVQHPITIAKVIADRPQVHFIKSAADDSGCPAGREACAYSCVSHQSAADRMPRWTVGWLPSATMTPIMPASAPALADWIGRWIHAGGEITISRGRRGNLRIRGEAVYPAAQNVHSGVMRAEAKPAHGVLQFADDGSVPFNRASAEAGHCLVRMQRIAALLVVEDNNHCGGVPMTFRGFYRRKS